MPFAAGRACGNGLRTPGLTIWRKTTTPSSARNSIPGFSRSTVFCRAPEWEGNALYGKLRRLFSKDPAPLPRKGGGRQKEREIDVGFVKYPFLKSGESREYPACAMAPVNKWEDGAKFYAKWAGSWRRPFKPADSLLSSNGWQRLIARHQYGKQFFKYSDFPKFSKTGLLPISTPYSCSAGSRKGTTRGIPTTLRNRSRAATRPSKRRSPNLKGRRKGNNILQRPAHRRRHGFLQEARA